MQNAPDIVQILTDAIHFARPALLFLIPISGFVTGITLMKSLCGIASFDRRSFEKEKKQRKEVEKVRVCDGCSSCPISKATGRTEEKCHLFGTASCCVGMKIDERGRLV